jgi:hypothetical protein
MDQISVCANSKTWIPNNVSGVSFDYSVFHGAIATFGSPFQCLPSSPKQFYTIVSG